MKALIPVKSLYSFLKSKKLALITIGLLGLFSVIGMIPQDTMAQRAVFSSWWFITVSVLFLLNLSLCLIGQVNCALRGGGARALGMVLFHAGILLIVIGGFVTTGFKMTGYMMIAEGETIAEEPASYLNLKKGFFFQNNMHTNRKITLLQQDPVLDKDGQVDYIRSHIQLADDDKVVAEQWIEKGVPFQYKSYRFFHYDAGYAPLVTIWEKSGQIFFQTFLLLNTNDEDEKKEATFSVVGQQLPGTSYLIDLEFWTESPRAKVRVFNQQGLELGQGIISQEKAITLSDGRTINLGPEIRRWTGLEVVNDQGAGILFVGCWVALAGLVLVYSKGVRLRREA